MKILDIKALAIPEIKVLRFARFADRRGYFTEPYRRSDFQALPQAECLRGLAFPQMNESWSRAGVLRGLHCQWKPQMGKLVRTIAGQMCDLVLDIRKGSPTLGKIIAYDLPAAAENDWCQWIWVPPGFAHGNFFTEPSYIEYFCTSEYSPGCEAGICPLAGDLDWSLCDPQLRARFQAFAACGPILSDKDRQGLSLGAWLADPRSENFVYGK